MFIVSKVGVINRVSLYLPFVLQVLDLTVLRGMSASDGIQTLESDAHYPEFGQAHNIAANVELERVYVIGSTQGSDPGVCEGGDVKFFYL